MKTNLSVVKNLVVVAILFASVVAKAQVNNLLAFNSEKKRAKVESRLMALTNEMEKSVRYEAPKVETEVEADAVETPAVVLDDVKEIRSWIKENFEKEALKNNLFIQGSSTVSFVVDKKGRIKNVTVAYGDEKAAKLLTSILKNAPSIKPLTMNGYAAKQYITLPISYRIEQM